MRELESEELMRIFLEDEIQELTNERNKYKDQTPQRRRIDDRIIRAEMNYRDRYGVFYKPKHLYTS